MAAGDKKVSYRRSEFNKIGFIPITKIHSVGQTLKPDLFHYNSGERIKLPNDYYAPVLFLCCFFKVIVTSAPTYS